MLVLLGCVSPPSIPDEMLTKEKMATILTEVHLHQTYVARMNLGSSDSSQIAYNYLEKAIFKQLKVDTASYKKSFMFYSMNPEYMKEIYEIVHTNINKKLDSINKKTQSTRITK